MAAAKKTTSRRKTTAPRTRVVRDDYEEMTQYPSLQMQPQRSGPSTLLVILLIAVSFFTGYLFFKVQNLEKNQGAAAQQVGNQPNAQPTRPTSLNIKKPSTDEHWKGSKDVRYVWVEYSDLECPFCKQIHPNLQKLMSENDGKVAWVFRHFPLSFHPKADPSAQIVECANDLGGNDAFWKAIDTVYEKMPSLEVADEPAALAAATGLDAGALKSCADAKKFDSKIKGEQSEGQNAGVQATPTNVIYDMKSGKTLLLEGALPYEQLKSQLENFMKG